LLLCLGGRFSQAALLFLQVAALLFGTVRRLAQTPFLFLLFAPPLFTFAPFLFLPYLLLLVGYVHRPGRGWSQGRQALQYHPEIGWSLVRMFLQALAEEVRQGLRQALPMSQGRLRRAKQRLAARLREPVNVGRRPDIYPFQFAQLFRCRIVERAGNGSTQQRLGADLRRLQRPPVHGQAKIDQLHPPARPVLGGQ
jgi:hypothetical protein